MSTPEKKALREEILARRDALPPRERARLSMAVWLLLSEMEAFAKAGRILFYASFRSEVETYDMMLSCLRMGKQVALPRAEPRSSQLFFYRVENLDELESGAYGILEPSPRPRNLVDASTFDLVVVPGSVFDPRGQRIGYGGGYYDRFLVNEGAGLKRAGLAYGFQVVPRIPDQDHDVSVDWIVTDERLIQCRPVP